MRFTVEHVVYCAFFYAMLLIFQMNLPQTLLPTTGKKLKKGQRRMLEQSKPIYLKSQDVT
jgi:hypothetical protein